jgi:excinuclease ABC subunit A
MGAIKPMQTPAWEECQDDLMRHAEAKPASPATRPGQADPRAAGLGHRRHAHWNGKWNKQWYGVKRFFEYLESKAYKMHIRVLLVQVPQLHALAADCGGARLKTESAAVAHGRQGSADAVLPPAQALHAVGVRGRARNSKPCPACACMT